METSTAHRAWNTAWSTESGRENWISPEPDVAELARDLYASAGARTALDLGCGVGRHALMLARLGYATTGVDMAENGLNELRKNAAAERLRIETVVAPMTRLPIPDASFDFVVAYNVIYHGDADVVRATLAEIRRVLRVGGVYCGTMLSKRSRALAKGRQVAPNTYVWDDREEEKTHPHFFCDAAELVELLAGLELSYLEDRRGSRSPENRHWHLTAERRS